MTKYKGVRIVSIKVVKYEVRDPTGHVMHRAATSTAARQWVNGFLAASSRALKQVEPEAVPAAKPKRTKKPADASAA